MADGVVGENSNINSGANSNEMSGSDANPSGEIQAQNGQVCYPIINRHFILVNAILRQIIAETDFSGILNLCLNHHLIIINSSFINSSFMP